MVVQMLTEEELEDCPTMETIIDRIKLFSSAILTTVGIPGTLLVLICFCSLHTHFPRRFNVYTIGFSLIQLIQLIICSPVRDLLIPHIGFDKLCTNHLNISMTDSFSCKCFTYLDTMFDTSKDAILATLTLERVYTVFTIDVNDSFASVHLAHVIVGLVSLISVFISMPNFAFIDLIATKLGLACSYSNDHDSGMVSLYTMSFFVSAALPFMLITIGSMIILMHLRQFRDRALSDGIAKSEIRAQREQFAATLMINTISVSCLLPMIITMLLLLVFSQPRNLVFSSRRFRLSMKIFQTYRRFHLISPSFAFLAIQMYRLTLKHVICNNLCKSLFL